MKRRILSIFCALCLCLGLLPVTALAIDQAPSGSGTEESPYQISTAGELFWFASLVNGTLEGVEQNTAACAVLTADINLSGRTWTPIGTSTRNYFEGTFDGGGNTISNLTIDTEASYVGLFGATSGAVIKNVTLDEPQVQNSATGTSQLAALLAMRCMGACLFSASCTMRMSFCRELSSPTWVAAISMEPKQLRVPQNTSSPAALSTGRDSPVITD